MNKAVIYQHEGGVAVLYPTPEALASWTIEQIAEKDVPHGRPFKIVDVTDIPVDRTFRNAWEVDASALTDGVGAESNEFPKPPEPATPVEPEPVQPDEVQS
jgi:hypothetical protein